MSDNIGGLDTMSEHIKAFYEDCMGVLADTFTASFDGVWQGVGADEGQGISVDAWSQPGGGAGGSLPPANCICIGWKTLSGGRKGMGRTFLGPIHTFALEANGTVKGESLTVVRTAADNFIAASAGLTGGAFGVFSQEDGLLRDWVSATVRDKFAVLRSRRD